MMRNTSGLTVQVMLPDVTVPPASTRGDRFPIDQLEARLPALRFTAGQDHI
jgi:hypothetical protein